MKFDPDKLELSVSSDYVAFSSATRKINIQYKQDDTLVPSEPITVTIKATRKPIFNSDKVTIEVGKSATLELSKLEGDKIDQSKLQPLNEAPLKFDPAKLELSVSSDYVALSDVTKKINIQYKQDEKTTIPSEPITVTIKANRVLIVKVEGEIISKDQVVELYKEDNKSVKLVYSDGKAETQDKPPAFVLISEQPNFVKIGDNNNTIIGQDAVNGSRSKITVKIGDKEQPELSFTGKILESIDKIEVTDLSANVVAEEEHVTGKLKITGSKGTILTFKERMIPVDKEIIDKDLASSTRDNLAPASQLANVTITGDVVEVRTLSLLLPNNPRLAPSIPHPAGSVRNIIIKFKIKSKPSKGEDKYAEMGLRITAKAGSITFVPPPRGFLMPSGSLSFTAFVISKEGATLPTPLTFDFADQSQKQWLTLAPEGNKINIYWNEPPKPAPGSPSKDVVRPSQIIIVAKTDVGDSPIVGRIYISMGEITKFAPLKVKLNPMDERMASDLYGSVTSKEYHILTVRLFNNLKDEESNQYFGSSILAYSASIEMAVGLEKKFDAKSGSDFPNVISKKAAEAISRQQSEAAEQIARENAVEYGKQAAADQKKLKDAINVLSGLESKASQLERTVQILEYEIRLRGTTGTELQKRFEQKREEAAQAREESNLKLAEVIGLRDSINLALGGSAFIPQNPMDAIFSEAVVDDGKWHPLTQTDMYRISNQQNTWDEAIRKRIGEYKPEDEPTCVGVLKYRPFTFEMIVNTVDRRDDRSIRSRVFKAFDLFGTGVSFITSVAVPGKNSDLPLGLEKYSNLLLPGLDTLFPSLKEQQRQNIVSQVMKPIEEIPFGSDITRVLFIPKKTIKGLIRGHDVRISEICPYFFSIEVAIIKKGGVVQVGSTPAP
ncbi:MAG: hypothetical protein WBV94_07515 [Blastocatellia bacterium]